jgi:multidrug/hemolysin transport system permease protein
MYTDNWVDIVSQFPAFSVERASLAWIVDSLMFAGILPIGAVTISLVVLGLMVADKEKNVLSDFLVSPVGRNSLLTSYLVSSFIVGFSILLGFVIFFQLYFLFAYNVIFSFTQFGLLLLTLVGSLVFANTFMLLIVSFLKSQQSLGAVGTIIGTLIGFLSGAYIPVGLFGEKVGNIFSALPFLQITVLTRKVFLYELESVTPFTREMLTGDIFRTFGIEHWFGNTLVPAWGTSLIAGSITLVLLICLIFRFSKMKKID